MASPLAGHRVPFAHGAPAGEAPQQALQAQLVQQQQHSPLGPRRQPPLAQPLPRFGAQ